MSRSAVAVALPHDEYVAISEPLAEAGYEPLEVSSAEDLERLLKEREEIGLAVLDGEHDFDQTIEMYTLLRDQERRIPALVAVSPRAMDRMRLAGHAGHGDEYFTRPYSAESIRWRVEAMLIRSETWGSVESEPVLRTRLRAPAAADVRRGRLVVIFNPKGGVGKTTIAVNLAAALQMRKHEKVMLVDCDTVTGHVAASLGMSGIRTVVDAWTEDFTTGNNESFREIASIHRSGVSVLVMAESPLHTAVLDAKRVAEAIETAHREFDWTIVDMHPDYGPLNQAIFAKAHRIIVPVTPDLPTIRAAIQFFRVADELGIRDKLVLVVNRHNSGVSVGDVEKTTSMQAYGKVRSAGMLFVRASNEGLSAVERFPTEKVIGDIDALAERLMRDVQPTIEIVPAQTRLQAAVRSLRSAVRVARNRLSGGDKHARRAS